MITIQDLFWLIPSASVLALIFAGIFFYRMKAQDEGNEVMKMIARHVRSGAMAYLRQQYKIVAIFFVLITVVFAFLAYCLHIQNPWVPFAFISGGFFSGLAGYIGMKTATYASGRVANACRHSLDAGLQIAFRSGAVLGLTVVGLAMLDIGAWYWVLNWFYGDMELSMRLVVITTTMLTFGMGASLQALFARVGGGIFTKAADVGADLVRPAFRRTTPATPPPLRITWAITLGTWPAWARTFTNLTAVPFWLPPLWARLLTWPFLKWRSRPSLRPC